MQYILSELEFSQLTEAAKTQKIATDQIIANLCMDICNLQPIPMPLRVGEPVPWGCIRSHEHWHCDNCPVNNVCTWPDKSWSN